MSILLGIERLHQISLDINFFYLPYFHGYKAGYAYKTARI